MIGSTLPWPRETAADWPDGGGEVLAPGSNIVLDFHGDPFRAKLVVFSDGNHHMALADTLRAFCQDHPDIIDIFYATLPPRLLVRALETGSITMGNLRLTVRPHVFIGPAGILSPLAASGQVEPPIPFMRSLGFALLFRKGNPKSIRGAEDALRSGVRLALSNPWTETASFEIYEAALLAACPSAPSLSAFLRSEAVVKSKVIHHREIPELLAAGKADVSLVYHHLALRYVRIFPDLFDMLVLAPAAQPIGTTYHVALVGGGGAHGAALRDFLSSSAVTSIYEHHGMARP